ncbi:MAG: tRNA (N(6)-L-threonylcarbamoyladenosine(37)-C(2))-methylthiotransferase MtaB [Candidatus Aminicenantes bacterium]
MRSFSVQSFGCRVNQAEAFLWTEELQKHGLKYQRDLSGSDLILVNSCTVTRRADSDLRKFIRRVKRLNPHARMIVTGCYVERAPQALEDCPQIWKVFSNQKKKEVVKNILSSIPPQEPQPNLSFRSRALVKIQDGCNFRCAFCIVPHVRGRSVSVEKEEILSQIKAVVDQGFKEVVLTGIHLCSYGLDLKPPSSLVDLIRETECLPGLRNLRLSSLDPRFLTPPLIEYITGSSKVCPHFHFSLQYGSDDILRRMGRKISTADYAEILSRFRDHSPRASLGADILVGFPGENEEDFERTCRFLKSSPLTYFHVFSYSPRPGTPAASWPQVGEKIKKRRAASLRALSGRKNLEFRKFCLGKEFSGIVIKRRNGQAQILTSNYLKVFAPSCPSEEREEVRVKITQVSSKETKGNVLSP